MKKKVQVLKSTFFTVPQKSEDKGEIAQTYYTVYFKTYCDVYKRILRKYWLAASAVHIRGSLTPRCVSPSNLLNV